MNFSENWYTSSHWHKNNTGKVSWTSEVWIKRYEKVLHTDTDTHRLLQTGYFIVTDEICSSGTKTKIKTKKISETPLPGCMSWRKKFEHWILINLWITRNLYFDKFGFYLLSFSLNYIKVEPCSILWKSFYDKLKSLKRNKMADNNSLMIWMPLP